MSTTNSLRLSPRDVARVLFRHWRKIAAVFGGVIALALLTVMFYPRSYSSESKLMIRMGRESVALDPTATTGETIMLQKTQEDEVNAAVSILTGRSVFERAIDKVGADRILNDTPATESAGDASASSSGGSWIGSALVALGLSDPGTEMDRAVRHLEKGLSVSAPKQSVVITVSYTAKSPELAHDVVAAVTEAFLDEHTRLSQTDGSLEFFSDQVEKLHSDLTAAQMKLRDKKTEYGTTMVTNQTSIIERGKDAMRQKVYDLRSTENDLMSRYTDEYPPLKEVRRQREMAERMLLNEPESIAEVPAPTQKASGERLAKVTPASYQIVDQNAGSKAKADAELRSLNDQEVELAKLQREVTLLEGKYAMHVDKLEQARVNDALGRERITNVKVAQPASLVHKPVSPNKLLLVAGALVIGLIGSIGTAFAAEGIDRTLRTTNQVEEELGLPVLASIPCRKSSNGISAVSNGTNGYASRKCYRGLLSALRSANGSESDHIRTVGIVGCDGTKLRSKVAANLAIEAASSGSEPVLLIDADTRRRRVAKRFQLNGAPGWSELLAGKASADKCVVQAKPANLAVIGPGASQGATTVNGEAAKSAAELALIKDEYGLVVIDMPTASELDRARVADDWIDEAVLVVEAERTRTQSAQRAIKSLNLAGVRVAGIVLANRRDHIPRWLYQRL